MPKVEEGKQLHPTNKAKECPCVDDDNCYSASSCANSGGFGDFVSNQNVADVSSHSLIIMPIQDGDDIPSTKGCEVDDPTHEAQGDRMQSSATDEESSYEETDLTYVCPSPDPLCLSRHSNDILREIYWYVMADVDITTVDRDEISIGDVVRSLEREGILFWRDQRFSDSQDVALQMAQMQRSTFTGKISLEAQKAASEMAIDYDGFVKFVSPCARLFLKAFSEELVIPDWATFTTDMAYHFHLAERRTEGENAQYIPILRDADPNTWGLSICSIDGQRFSVGDALWPHSLQSVSKPVTYALGLTNEGKEFMEQWIGVEPAGRPFNTQDLDPQSNRPFNASINSGAIMAAGVYASGFPELTWREVVDKIRGTWFELCGGDLDVGFSKETYESEKSTAYNNFAIAYNLKGRKGLPRDIDLHKMLDVYLGCCAIQITTEALAVAAATLANGGVCPITGKEVFPAHVVRHVLSETMLCGTYDQAGHFAVEVGLPTKSGVSGALMVIVPNVFGFATFSPRLNSNGNSVRGATFCKQLVASYRVHVFEPLRSGNTGAKIDPRKNGSKNEMMQISRMAWAVAVGDVYAMRLRDIFLFALCQTAIASQEGLSVRMLDLIREIHEQVYQVPLDMKLFDDIVAAVSQHPNELRFLEKLTMDVHVVDSMRSLIIMSMVEIIMIDGKADEVEKSVAVRIAGLLGIDRNVALMELNRYEHHIGHRYKHMGYCHMIETVDADVSHRRARSSSNYRSRRLFSHSDAAVSPCPEMLGGRIAMEGAHHGLPSLNHSKPQKNGGIRNAMQHNELLNGQEGSYALRKEVMYLRKKVEQLSHLLHDNQAFHK